MWLLATLLLACVAARPIPADVITDWERERSKDSVAERRLAVSDFERTLELYRRVDMDQTLEAPKNPEQSATVVA
jgi:hypothetical protein